MTSTHIGHKQIRPTIFLVGCILIILLSAVATFLGRSDLPVRAASGDVVGPPTLPAATVDSILATMGSPMVGTGAVIEQASRETNIDDAFALAVWWTETNDGSAGVGLADRNPGSVRGSYGYPAAFDGYTIYSSYAAGIIDWFNVVRTRYVDRGLVSAYTICYPYVGTSSSYQWAIKVVNLMVRYQSEAPPPTATSLPTPTPIPSPDAVHIQHLQVHVVKPKPPTMGLTRETYIKGNNVPPVIAKPHTSSTHVSVPTSVAPLAPALPFIILSGLIGALLIALWGMVIGRSITTVSDPLSAPIIPMQPQSAFIAPEVTLLPVLSANEFSPAPVLQNEQLPWTSEPQPQPAFFTSTGDGLLKRYADTDVLPRKIRLRPVSIVNESGPPASDPGNWPGPLPETSSTFASFATPEQKNTPEPIAAGHPMGLLRRYAAEKDIHNE